MRTNFLIQLMKFVMREKKVVRTQYKGGALRVEIFPCKAKPHLPVVLIVQKTAFGRWVNVNMVGLN